MQDRISKRETINVKLQVHQVRRKRSLREHALVGAGVEVDEVDHFDDEVGGRTDGGRGHFTFINSLKLRL